MSSSLLTMCHILSVGLCAGQLSACGEQGHGRRYVSESGVSDTKDTISSGGGSVTETSGLPEYLFTLDAAGKITPLVLVFEPAKDPGEMPTHDTVFNKHRDFFTSFLNSGMALAALKPGRKFSVIVEHQDAFNAMDLDQTIVVNSGTIRASNAVSMAVILCHEAAHSTRNHGIKLEGSNDKLDSAKNPDARRLDEALTKFVAERFDTGHSTYHHNRAAFVAAKAEWDRFWKDMETDKKKIESEADIVGAQLCAQFGFSNTEIVQGVTDTMAKVGKAEAFNPNSKEADYSYQGATLTDYLSYLFDLQTHPAGPERVAQAKRIVPLLKTNESASVAATWKKGYGGLGLMALGGATEGLGGPGCSHVNAAERIFLDRIAKDR